MKAIVYSEYGSPDVLHLQKIERPQIGDTDILIKVHAASVNPLDWHFMRGTPYPLRLMTGLDRPKRRQLGVDVAGTVEAAGAKVTQCRPGDAVFGSCHGAFAEYARMAQSAAAKKPDGVTFEQAASVPIAALTALQALRNIGHLQPGQRVLINGASGGVGTFAVQIAKSYGADVTGVCSSRNLEMVRAIGADHVIDYTREDFTKGKERYDVALDTVGNHSLLEFRRVLTPSGRCVMVGGTNSRWKVGLLAILAAKVLSLLGHRKLITMLARLNKPDLTTMADLIRDGKVTPVIDRQYPLSETPEAMRYLETGHARGKVVITM